MTDHPSTRWRDHTGRHIDRTLAGALDVIDTGTPPPPTGRLRHPTTTDRNSADGQPTPAGPRTRNSIRPDPVAANVFAWATHVHRTIRRLEETGGTIIWMLREADITVTARPPDELPPDVVDPETGRVEPRLNPARAGRIAIAWKDWYEAVADRLADGWIEWDPRTVEADLWRSLAVNVQTVLAHTARRLRPDLPSPSRCSNPHGGLPHPLGQHDTWPTCGPCRNGSPPRQEDDDQPSAVRCDDRHGYGCHRPLPPAADRPTCWSCIGRAKRARRATVEAATHDDRCR